MLPYQHRLVKKEDFEAIYRYGSFFSFGLISLKVKKNDLSESRFGLSIGIKFSKKAVIRNKIKRQLRYLIKENLKEIKSGLDIVIMVKKTSSQTPSFTILAKDFKTILKKEKLIIN